MESILHKGVKNSKGGERLTFYIHKKKTFQNDFKNHDRAFYMRNIFSFIFQIEFKTVSLTKTLKVLEYLGAIFS